MNQMQQNIQSHNYTLGQSNQNALNPYFQESLSPNQDDDNYDYSEDDHDTRNHDMPLSGVAQNLQNFLSNTFLNSSTSNTHNNNVNTNQNTAVFNTNAHQSVQDDNEPNHQHHHLNNVNQSHEQLNMEENQIIYLQQMPKTKQRSLSLQQEQQSPRFQSQKQVRFTIKDGLKNLIDSSNIEIESIASRSQSVNKQRVTGIRDKQSLRQSQVVRQSKSPGGNNRNSETRNQSQSRRKSVSYKTRQLALKYKREADQNRKKKFGEQISIQSNEDIINTPGQTTFTNQALTERTVQIEKTPEKVQQPPPQPIQHPQKLETLLAQYGPKSDRQTDQKALPQEQTKPQIQPIQPQMVGTIVKRNQLQVQNDVNNQATHLQRRQAGMIIRQRSTSPANALSLGRNKENQSMMLNASVFAGQIIKIQNQKLNCTQQVIPQQQIFSPQSTDQQMPRVIHQNLSPTRMTPILQSNKFQTPKVQVQPQQSKPLKLDIFFNTLWESFTHPTSTITTSIDKSTSQLSNLRYTLLTTLTHQTLQPQTFSPSYISHQSQSKLKCLRQILFHLYKEAFYEQILAIAQLRDRKLQKQQQLKECIKQSIRNSRSNNQLLKCELLRDIISRLTQKIVIASLRLNNQVRKEVVQQFNTYYLEYIAKDYKQCALRQLQAYFQKRQQKNQYLYYAREQLMRVKSQQVFYAWKNIRLYQQQTQDKLNQAKTILLSRKMTRVVTFWKIAIIEQRNYQLANAIIIEREKMKYHQQLFIKWVYNHRMQNRIKRKAIQMMSSPSTKKRQGRIDEYISDEQWFKSQIQKIEANFNHTISEFLLEREHNKTFIQGLKYKMRIEELNHLYPLRLNLNSPNLRGNDFTMARSMNEIKIYQQYPELRFKSPLRAQRVQTPNLVRSNSQQLDSPQEVNLTNQKQGIVRRSVEIDIELKYSIHSALVYHQNNQMSNQQIRQQNESFISYQQRSEQKQVPQYKKLIPPPPKRLIELERSAVKTEQERSFVAPNQLFRKLQNQLISQTPSSNMQSRTDPQLNALPLDLQLREHISTLQRKIHNLENLSYNYHFTQSLKHHAVNVIANNDDSNEQDDFKGLTDYIQYGISCDQYRMVFIKMFKTKVLSVLFQQWKKKFLKRQLYEDLRSYQVIQIGKQAFIEWDRVVKSKKLKIKEFQRMRQIKRFYSIFINWAQWNIKNTYDENNKIRQYRLRSIFTHWIKYLEGQGQTLMKILQAQQYYKQALMSKSLLCLYKNYLRALRVRRFQRKQVFTKFFKKGWLLSYKRRIYLQKLLTKLDERVILNERLKYQREFEIKQEVLIQWKERVQDKQRLIQQYTALTHYKQTLVCKSFLAWKKHFRVVQGLQRLSMIPLIYRVNPAFQAIKESTQTQAKTEKSFQNYRQSYLVASVFTKLREHTVENKLSKLFMKKRVFNNWALYNQRKNHDLPYDYRRRVLCMAFFATMKNIIAAKWAEQRSQILERNLRKDKQIKIMRQVFLSLLENVLIQKKRRIIESTTMDFRNHTLMSRAFRGLRRLWSKRGKERLFNKVAKEFYHKIRKRRELKRRQQYGEIGEMDEHRTLKHRVFTSWRLHTEHSITKQLVLKRFLDYKKRLKLLRTFLAWRSFAKYEHSVLTTHHKDSRLQYDSDNYSQHSQSYPQLPFSVQSPQIFDAKCFNKDRRTNNPNNLNYDNLATYNKPTTTTLIGSQDLTLIKPTTTPLKDPSIQQDKSLFDELETIFMKNRKWLEEQREREEFLREMASHYNQRLSQEMNSLKYQTLRSSHGQSQYTSNNHNHFTLGSSGYGIQHDESIVVNSGQYQLNSGHL